MQTMATWARTKGPLNSLSGLLKDYKKSLMLCLEYNNVMTIYVKLFPASSTSYVEVREEQRGCLK